MSTVDNRVVKLQFDNAQFEKNVSKSMATLDKLEEKLQFKKAAKGFETLKGGIDSVDFGDVEKKLDHLDKYFTKIGGRIEKAFKDKIFGSIKTLYSNTLGQIESGGWNRAMNIENAKFSIEGLKEDWNELYKAMDYAVTGTAYGIDQAATAAASLVASGVGYTEVIEKSGDTQVTAMHKALRAISGVAAQTNSDFSSIANIFTTVAGQGRLMGDQLNQLAARGMNAAAKLAEALGTTEADVREAVSAGAIDFETFAFAMDDAFGEHATDANKTFTGSLSNMKAALSRFGAVFATPVIQKTNKFFIALTDRIKEMKKAISDVVVNGEVLEEHLESHFAQMWQNLIDLADTLVHKIDLTWFWNIADAVDTAVTKIRDLLDILNKVFNKTAGATADTADTVYDLATITAAELELAENVIKGAYGNGQKRMKALGEAAGKLGLDPVKIQEYVNAVAGYGYSFEKAGIKIAEVTDAEEELGTTAIYQKRITDNYTIAFHNLEIAINNIKTAFSDLSDAFSAGFFGPNENTDLFWVLIVNGSAHLREFSVMLSKFSRALLGNSDALEVVYNIAVTLSDILETINWTIHDMIMDVGNIITETLDWWGYTGELGAALDNVYSILLSFRGTVENVFTTLRRITKSVLTALLRVLSPSRLTGVLLGFSDALYGVSSKLYLSEEGAERLTDVLTVVFDVVQSVVLGIGTLISNIAQFLSGIRRTETGTEKSSKGFGILADSFEFTGTAVSVLLDKLMALPEFLTELFDILENNEGVIRLKTAITTLAETIKTAISTAIRPFAESLGLIDQGDDTTTAAQKVGGAIGWIADKIAIVIEQIPTWIDAVGAFFEKVEGKVDEFKTWIGDNIDFEGIEEAITGFFNPEEGESFVDNIKAFGEGLFDRVTEELDSVDWSELGENSLILGILAMIWKLLGIADTVDGVIESVGEIPEKIGEVIEGLGEVLASTAGLISNFGTASLIVSIAALIISIAGAMVLLARIPEDDLQRIGTIIESILLVIVLLTLIIKKIQDAKLLKLIAKGEIGVKMAKIKAQKMFLRFLGIALIIVALGVSIKLIISALIDLYDVMTRADFKAGKFALAIIVIIGVLVVVFFATLGLMEFAIAFMKRIKTMVSDANKQIVMMTKFGWILIGMAAVLAGFGLAVYLIAKAIAELSSVEISGTAVLIVVGIIAALGFAIGYIMHAFTSNARDVKAKDLLALAGIIFVFTLGLSAILLSALGVASLAMMASFGGKEGVIEVILAEIMGFVLVLGIAIGIIIKNAKGLQKKHTKTLWAIAAIIAVLALTIVAVGYAIKMMAEGFGSFNVSENAVGIALMGIIGVIAVITAAVSHIIDAVAKHNVTGNRMKMLGIVIGLVAVIGAVIVAIGYSIKLMTSNIGGMESEEVGLAVIFSGLVATLGIIILGTVKLLETISTNNIKDKQLYAVAAVISSFGVMMILIGVSFSIIADAISGLDGTKLWLAVGVLLGSTILMIGAFIGLLLIMKKIGPGAEDLALKAAGSMALMCSALLVIAGALWILSKIEWNTNMLWGLLASVGVIALLFAGLYFVLSKLSSTSGEDAKTIGKNLVLAATALVIMAASLIVFAIACQILTGVDPGLLIAAAAALGIFMAVLMAGAYLLSRASVDPKILQGIALAILAIGGSVLLAAVGIALLAVVLPKLGDALNKIAVPMANFFSVLETHWKAAIGIGIAIVLVLGLAVVALWAIKAVLAPVVTAFAQGANVILQTLGTLAGQFGNWLSHAFSSLATKAKEIGPKLGLTIVTIILAVGSALTQHGPKLLQILGKLIIMVLDWLAEAIGPITSKLIDLLIKLIEGLADAISTHANQIGAAIMKFVYAIIGLVIGVVGQVLRGVFGLFGGAAASWYDKHIGPALTKAQEGLKALGDDQMAIARMQDEAIAGDGRAYEKWVQEYTDVDSAMKQVEEEQHAVIAANKKLEEQAASTDHTLSGLKNTFANKFGVDTYANDINAIDMSHLPDAAKNAMMSQGTGAWGDDGKFYQFTTVAKEDVAGAEAAYGDFQLPENALNMDLGEKYGLTEPDGFDAGNAWTDGVAGGIFEGQDDVVGATNSNVDAQIDTIDSRQGELKDAGKRGVDSHISGIESKGPEVAAATRTSVIGPITSTLSGFANAPIGSNYGAPKLGNDIGLGVITGYEEAMSTWIEGGYLTPGSAANSTYNAAQAIKDGFVGPRAMDINSPSKVSYGWGMNIIQGLTNGIINNTDSAVSSMGDLSNAMIISFGNPLDYAARVASGEFKYDPSIRPVLDTSNIARGASGIHTLFDNQNVAISGFSGKLATDITGLDTTNMAMVTELRALRSDMNAMTEQITNMQIVMDGGQLVGAIAPTMDNALGNRAAMRRRGN